MRKILALSLCFSIPVSAALAADDVAEKPAAAKASENSVDMPKLIAPVLVDGRLQGYFYISSKLTATNATTALTVTNKIPFIQDAFVRDVNANPIQVTEAAQVDRAKFGQRLVANARKVMGNNSVTGIIFGDGAKDIGLMYAPLRGGVAPLLVPQEQLEADAAPAPKPAAKQH